MAEPERLEFGEGEGATIEVKSPEVLAVELQDFLKKYVTPTWTEEFLHGSDVPVPHGANFSEKYFTIFPPEIHEPVKIALEKYEAEYGRDAAFFFIPKLADQIEHSYRIGVEPSKILTAPSFQALHKRAIVARDAAKGQPIGRTLVEFVGKVPGAIAETVTAAVTAIPTAMVELAVPETLVAPAVKEELRYKPEEFRQDISDAASAISPVLKEATEDIFGSPEDRESVFTEVAKVYGQTTDQIEQKWEESLPQNIKNDIVENFRGIAHLASVIWLGGDVAPEDWALPLDEFYKGSLGRGRQLTRTIIGGMVGSVGAIMGNMPESLYTHPFTLAMLMAPIAAKLPANVVSRMPPSAVKAIAVLNLLAQIDPIGGPGALLRGAKTLLKAGKVDIGTVKAMVARELGLTEAEFSERQGHIREAAEQYISDSKARGNLSEAEVATVIANDPKAAANNIATLMAALGREAGRAELQIDRYTGTRRGGVPEAERMGAGPAETRAHVAELTRRIREGEVPPPPTEPPAGAPPPPTEPPARPAPRRGVAEIAADIAENKEVIKIAKEELFVTEQALADAIDEGLTPNEVRVLQQRQGGLVDAIANLESLVKDLEVEGGLGGPRGVVEATVIEHRAPLDALEPLADTLQREGILYEGIQGAPDGSPFMHGFQGVEGKMQGSSFNVKQSRINEIGLEAAFKEALDKIEAQHEGVIRKYTAEEFDDISSGRKTEAQVDAEIAAEAKAAVTPDEPIAVTPEEPTVATRARGTDIEALKERIRRVGTSKLADPSKTSLIDVRMDDAGNLKTVTEYAEFQRTINDPRFREDAIAVLSEELGMPREEIATRLNDEAFIYAFMPEALPHEVVRAFAESDNMTLLTDQLAERLSLTFPQKELVISDNMPIVQGIKRSLSDDPITKVQIEQAITSAFRDTAVHQLMRSPRARNIFLGRMKKKHGIPYKAMDNILVDMTNATLFDSPFNYIIELPGGGSLNLLFEMESFFREMNPKLFKKVSQEAFQKVSQQLTNQVENIKLKEILGHESNRFNSTVPDPRKNMLDVDPRLAYRRRQPVKPPDATTYVDNIAYKVIGLGEAPPSILVHNAKEVAQRLRALDPATLAARLDDSIDAVQFKGRPEEVSFVANELIRLANRMEKKYTPADPSLRNILPEGTTGVTKALNRQMRFQRNVISDMSPLYNSLMSFTTLLKGNVTVRNPSTHVNNFTANLLMQSTRTGRMPSSILKEAISINSQYQKYLRGTLDDPVLAQTFRDIEMSGLIDTDLVDAELTYMNSAISKETTGSPFTHLPEPMAALLRTNFAKKTYKMGDQIFKMAEAVRAYKELSGAVTTLRDKGTPGQYVEWQIGGGRKVQIVKKGDGGLGIATYDRGNHAIAFLDFVERAKRNDVPDAVRMEDVSELFGEGSVMAPDSPLSRALSDGAAQPALNIFFDYADAPLYAMALRQVPVIGLAAPFVTWFYKAIDIPPIPGVTKGKKGLVSHVLLGDGGLVTSNVGAIADGQMMKVAANSARRFALMNAARSQLQDEPELLKDIVMRDKRGSGAALIYETLNPWYNNTVDLENITYYGPTETFFKVGLPAMLSVADNAYSVFYKAMDVPPIGALAEKVGIPPEHLPPSLSAVMYDFDINDAGRIIIDNSDLEKAARGGLIDKAQAKLTKNIRDINARRLTGEYMNPQDVLELIGLTGGFLGDILVEVAAAERQDRPVRMHFYLAKFATLMAGGLPTKISEAGWAKLNPNDPSTLRLYALRPDPYESEELNRYMVRLFVGAVFAGKKRMTAKQSNEAIKRTVNTMKKALMGDLKKKRDRLAADGRSAAAEAMNDKIKIQMAIFEEEGIRLQRAINATTEKVVGERIQRLEEKGVEYDR